MAAGPSRSPRKRPHEAEDSEPDFDIAPNLYKLKAGLNWTDAKDRVAMVGLSRQLHKLLHDFDPNRIGPTAGPYPNALVADVFSSYVVQHRHLLTSPAYPGHCVASGIAELHLIMGIDHCPFNTVAIYLRRHMVLLDIVGAAP